MIAIPAEIADINLTARQRQFVDKYLTCLNATQSAIHAGYSQRSARQIGAELLTNPHVRDVIQKRLQESAVKDDITPDFIRKGVKDTISECKNPKDKFIGYELLAKATPGTFEPMQSNTNVNLFAILRDLPRPVSGSTASQAIPLAMPAIPTQPTTVCTPYIGKGDSLGIDKNSLGIKAGTPQEVIPPQATPIDIYTVSNKIDGQISKIAQVCEVSVGTDSDTTTPKDDNANDSTTTTAQ